jgi:hypothetical protein
MHSTNTSGFYLRLRPASRLGAWRCPGNLQKGDNRRFKAFVVALRARSPKQRLDEIRESIFGLLSGFPQFQPALFSISLSVIRGRMSPLSNLREAMPRMVSL